MLGLPFQRLPPHHKGGGFDLASSLVQVKPVRFTAKLGILKRSTELCTSRREQWHQHRVHQAAAAGEGGGNSPPYSSNSSSSSEIKHSWLQSLLAQPFVAKLAQRIPKVQNKHCIGLLWLQGYCMLCLGCMEEDEQTFGRIE